MKVMIWLLAFALVACFGYWLWRSTRRMAERRAAAEEREASFMAQAMGAKVAPASAANAAAPKAATPGVKEQLLLEAAAKAAAAGEPALSIQLYARLLSRFPQSTLATQARAAVEEQKKKLAIATAPGPAGPG